MNNLNNEIFCIFKMKYGLEKVEAFTNMLVEMNELQNKNDYDTYFWKQKQEQLKQEQNGTER